MRSDKIEPALEQIGSHVAPVGKREADVEAPQEEEMLKAAEGDQTVHMWALVLATAQSTQILTVAPLLLSLLINVVKVLVLGSMVTDALQPRCRTSSDCKGGQFCSESFRNFCTDCAVAFTDNISATGFSTAGLIHCAQDDPRVCEYIENDRMDLNVLDILLVVFAGMLMARMALVDLGQLAREQLVLAGRLRSVNHPARRGAVLGLSYLNFLIRAHVLPSFLAAATNSLLLTFGPTTRSIIFAGVAVGSAFNFDSVASNVIFSGRGQRGVEAMNSAIGATKVVVQRHRPLSGHMLQYNCRSPPPPKERLEVLAFDVSGDGYTRAPQAQWWYTLLLAVSTVLYYLCPPNIFLPTIRGLASVNGVGLEVSVIGNLPCTAAAMTGIYLPFLATLIAIPLEHLTDTYVLDAYRWRGLATRGSSVPPALESVLATLLRMALFWGVYLLHQMMLVALIIHPFDQRSAMPFIRDVDVGQSA